MGVKLLPCPECKRGPINICAIPYSNPKRMRVQCRNMGCKKPVVLDFECGSRLAAAKMWNEAVKK